MSDLVKPIPRRPRRSHERFFAHGLDRWLFCDGCGHIVYDDEPIDRLELGGPGGTVVFAGHTSCIGRLEQGIDGLPIATAQGPGTAGRGRKDSPASRQRRLGAG